VGSLTPLDMVDLSWGRSDATGNRIWMGALLFVECMARPLHHRLRMPSFSSQLLDLRRKLFDGKRVLELGAGTGAALLSIGLAGTVADRENCDSDCVDKIKPSAMTFTDGDATVLELLELNCEANLRDKFPDEDWNYIVRRLEWGSASGDNEDLAGSQDTVLATDVIYDISAIPILFETAASLLKPGGGCDGRFVLSHVPRADIDCDRPSQINEALETLILEEAAKNGFELDSGPGSLIDENDYAIRPGTLMKIFGDAPMTDDYDYEEFETAGASVMIFAKTAPAVATAARGTG